MGKARSKSVKNVLYGLIGQLITIGLGLLIPRLILLNYGSDANGFVSSITQIFAYVALLEAGVGGAALQALYKPIGTDDKKSVSEILAATHLYYRKTGAIYAIAVIALALFYPLFIDTNLNYWTAFGVIIFNGMGGAINYLFQGKYHILLQAEGKNYIKTNLTTIIYVISSILKIILIIAGFGILALQISYFILNIFQMFYIIIYIRKHYSWLNIKTKPNFQAISQKNSVMVHQISALIFGNTDSIILTIFCGLKSVSVYSLINSFIGQINNLLSNVSSGILFALGQNFSNNKKKFNELYTAFELIYFMMMTVCLFMIFIFLNPFLSLYTEGVTDVGYVDKYLPTLFVVCYYLTWARVPSTYVINNCAGHYKETQMRSIIESIINIGVSLVCVNVLGIYGVLFGTIAALIYRTNDMIIYSAKRILNRKLFDAYKYLIINLVWLIICCAVGTHFKPIIDTYLDLILYGLIYGVIMTICTLFINFIINRNVFIFTIKLFTSKNRK